MYYNCKKSGATDIEISVSNTISDTINYRNKNKEQSDRSEILSLGLITYIGKKNQMFLHQTLMKKISKI